VAINGIETLVYGVDDVPLSARFFADFGLPLVQSDAELSRFRLEEGSHVVIGRVDSMKPRDSVLVGPGVQEVILGVDTPANLEALVVRVGKDREVRRDEDGTAHFIIDGGVPFGLRVFPKKQVVTSPDPLNSPGNVNRLNRNRRYRKRAIPKVIQHVVFAVQNVEESFHFLKDRLDFRITDYQPGLGIYARCDGTNNHHNVFLLDASLPFPGLDGQTRFHHANFGVEDIDEMMVGANYMVRAGWEPSTLGIGRHRTDSALFYYLPCPAGGEAEYGADGDYVDDAWVPRYWSSPLFGYAHYVHNVPHFLREEPKWDVRYLTEEDYLKDATYAPRAPASEASHS
jgi:catechol 2,3-dioxygenase-like lactoylglutathione lyase family enzyme